MRALCVLDPYGLHLDWSVVSQCGHAGSIELFLNFPIYDINLNVHKKDDSRVRTSDRERLNAFWGDTSWQDVMYSSEENLFGLQDPVGGNSEIVAAYRRRLVTVAGFEYVPEPVAMYNRMNADLYYLFFASHNKTAGKIVSDIFKSYNGRGVRYGSRIKH
jgi:three-Cys-motif partner protein